MEISVTAYVLQYLLKNCFASKADMARKLDLLPRTLERTFKRLDVGKASALAFDHAVEYCAVHHISLDAILQEFAESIENDNRIEAIDGQACHRLRLNQPENLSEEGKEIFDSLFRFLRQTSAEICPFCETWCNPWDGKRYAEKLNCCIGYIAREIIKDTTEFYSEEGNVI